MQGLSFQQRKLADAIILSVSPRSLPTSPIMGLSCEMLSGLVCVDAHCQFPSGHFLATFWIVEVVSLGRRPDYSGHLHELSTVIFRPSCPFARHFGSALIFVGWSRMSAGHGQTRSCLDSKHVSCLNRRPLSCLNRRHNSSRPEAEQMSAAETGQMLKSQIRGRASQQQ